MTLTRHSKTKFSTVKPLIYLPKWQIWMQLSPNCILLVIIRCTSATCFLREVRKKINTFWLKKEPYLKVWYKEYCTVLKQNAVSGFNWDHVQQVNSKPTQLLTVPVEIVLIICETNVHPWQHWHCLCYQPNCVEWLFYHNTLDQSVSNSWMSSYFVLLHVLCFMEIPVFHASSIDKDQMPHYVASDLGLHCLQITNFGIS